MPGAGELTSSPVKALSSTDAMQCSVSRVGDSTAVVAAWDFSVQGGSFGVADASAYVAAVSVAVDERLPLVSVIASGGTRLTEGTAALTGIPRAALALRRLAAAGLPHVAVCASPTTGGVWVAVGSRADVRIAVAGAVVAFSGPRVVAAMTDRPPAVGSGTAEDAYDVGLVDLLVEPGELTETVDRVLATLRPDSPVPPGTVAESTVATGSSWQQVEASRRSDRPAGTQQLGDWLTEPVPLRGGDTTVAAAVGRLSGRRAVGVALAAARAGMVSTAGYRLLARAAGLADRWRLPLLVAVDTAGADPHSERDGLAAAIDAAMAAVLDCRAPTVALVHGAGGSGGALAGAVTDVVGITELGWFAPLGPEGAAAALGTTPQAAAEMMRITPADLLDRGVVDELVDAGTAAHWLAATVDRLAGEDERQRRPRRHARWSAEPESLATPE